jgi:hypothetical protein
MARIAIVGSCITRDLWPVRGGGAEEFVYISRTSLASLMAPPVTGFRPAAAPPPPLLGHQHRAVIADLQKTALGRLVAFRPSHLIFDFIDERFDLMAVGDALVTRSWELEASGYLAKRALKGGRVIPRLSTACDRLWDRSAEEFAALVRATPLRDARLILHAARWANASVDASGRERPVEQVEVTRGAPADIDAHNDLLARYEDTFRRLMPPLDVVEAPAHRLADEDHRWGLSPFHYVPAYYEAIWGQLQALGIRRVSEGAAAPNAPAA